MATLTAKQKAFIAFYVETLNATEAARQAGYKGSYATLRSIGSENLTKPNINAEIQKRLKKIAMSAEEALARLAIQARGVDMEKVGQVFEDAVTFADIFKRAHQSGMSFYIKSVKHTQSGINIEFHDAQAALFKVLQVHGLLKERVVVEDWRVVAVKEIQQGNIGFDQLAEALGDRDLAVDLFRRAGVVPVVSGEA